MNTPPTHNRPTLQQQWLLWAGAVAAGLALYAWSWTWVL